MYLLHLRFEIWGLGFGLWGCAFNRASSKNGQQTSFLFYLSLSLFVVAYISTWHVLTLEIWGSGVGMCG
jgi:hypothetical protein